MKFIQALTSLKINRARHNLNVKAYQNVKKTTLLGTTIKKYINHRIQPTKEPYNHSYKIYFDYL